MRRLWMTGVTVGLTCAIFLLAGWVSGFGASATTGSSGAFSQSESIARDFNVNGTDTVVDSRNFGVTVSQTSNLFGRQELQVSWTGAHPTGGIVADQNSSAAQYEEYPVVLLECRGVDSTSPPSGQQQLSPETCWTQDSSERYQESYGDLYPPYRLDEYATASDTQAVVGAPAQNPAACAALGEYVPGIDDPPVQRWVPWEAADGTLYYGGNGGCAGQPPEAGATAALPSNETFGVSDAQGNGSAEFDTFTAQENQTLGCSTTVDCSMVVVPIMGISCEVTPTTPVADASECEDTGYYTTPGSPSDGDPTSSQTAVTGSLWWSASNWRNRITVPLSFATTASACALTGGTSGNSIDIFGSESMIRATDQWEPYFCLGEDHNDNFSFVHVQTGEPEARNLVASGGAEAAFTEYPQPNGYAAPTVNAPVAMTGFTISYDISGDGGQQYQNLKLTPLMLAKLLTESYPDTSSYAKFNTGIGDNPQNITQDPEFEQLNPGIPTLYSTDAAAELVSLSSDSDVIEALTTYINDDPAARAWLNGSSSGEPSACNSAGQYAAGASDACPAMVVNPAYKGIQLPVDQWPLLAPLDPQSFYDQFNQPGNSCLFDSPVPYLDAIASPLATLESISEDIQFEQPNSAVSCSSVGTSKTGEKLVADTRQGAGQYFMLGITPLADDSPFALQPALLQTTPGNFVGPTTSALQATASLLKPDATTGTWPIPYSEFETAKGQSAYPGSLVVYAAVPTQGLPKADAADLGQILQFAATTGQQQGTDPGQLPPGYLPLTSANGLGGLAAYTQAAAADVTAQNGQVPPMVAASSSGSSSGSSTSNGHTTSTAASKAKGSQSGRSTSTQGSSGGGYPDTAGTSTTTASGGHGASAKHKVSPLGVLLMPIQAVAERLENWLAFLGADGIFALCLFGLAAVPSALVVGRRRGMW